MPSALQTEYLSIQGVNTAEALLAEMVRFSNRLGFELVSALAVVDRVAGEPAFFPLDNGPVGVPALDDPRFGKFDPVMQHCKTQSVPIVWDQATYLQADQAEKWEFQSEYGYRSGIAWAMHMPAGRHFVFGVDRSSALPADRRELTQMTAAFQLFAVHAQDAAMRILVPHSPEAPTPVLTARELEALRWTMEGKTAWEIGRILGIAENTAIRHAYSASRKLGCSSKHHAVVKALRLGLIQ